MGCEGERGWSEDVESFSIPLFVFVLMEVKKKVTNFFFFFSSLFSSFSFSFFFPIFSLFHRSCSCSIFVKSTQKF